MSTTRRRERALSPDLVAGNGLINRRALLGSSIAVAGAMGTAGTRTGAAAEALKDEQWSLEFGSIMPPVQTASKYEKDVARMLSNPKGEFRNSHARTPHHLLSGTITPNGLHFSINHCGVPEARGLSLSAPSDIEWPEVTMNSATDKLNQQSSHA